MKKCSFLWVGLLCLSFAATLPALAQQAPAPKAGGDFSGVWVQLGGGGEPDRKSPLTGNASPFKGFPQSKWSDQLLPYSAQGLAILSKIKPGRGPRGVKRQQDDQDPIHGGNPWGLYRTLTYQPSRPFQFVQVPGMVIQLFSPGRIFRIIYTDGRPVPADVAEGPFWYGYSVGHWEGDTLVVHTLALDGRAWLDEWGTPMTDDTRVVERWRRVSRTELQLQITVSDPTLYTRPWTSAVMHYFLQNIEPTEMINAPMDENFFNQNLRDPADAGTKGQP